MFEKQIRDLKDVSIVNSQNIKKLREMTKILIIDDQPFGYLESLHKSSFNLEQREDIVSISDCAEYEIVICDIRGIGKNLKSEYEGAYLASQIKKSYPDHYVMIYSANDYKADYQKFFDSVDEYVGKGEDASFWSELFDNAIEQRLNPTKLWEKTSIRLLKAGISTKSLLKIESAYVKSILKKDQSKFAKLLSNKSLSNYSTELNSLLTLISIIVTIIAL